MLQQIGIVIVTYNNASMLRSLLEDLLDQTRKPDEIIVIDNASLDNTESMISAYPAVRYMRLKENIGSAGGYYEGLKIASENNDFVWTLDDDMIVNKDAIEVLVRWWDILEKKHRLGVIRSWIGDAPESLKPFIIDSFAWRGTFLKKEVILDVGLPLKEYFLYAEDDEYAHRIIKQGYTMLTIPESQITERRTEDKMRLHGWGRQIVLYKESFRFYYAFRNQIALYRTYKECYNLFKTFCYAVKVTLFFILKKNLKSIDLIKSVLEGVWDGLRLNLGKNPKYLPHV